MSVEELNTITTALSGEEFLLEGLSPKPEEWTGDTEEPVVGYGEEEAVDGAVVADTEEFELPDNVATSDLMFPVGSS